MSQFITTERIGNWFSTILLGNTRELLASINERTKNIDQDHKLLISIDERTKNISSDHELLASINERTKHIDKDHDLLVRINERTEQMSKDLDEIRPKVNDMWPKVEILWRDRAAPTKSPRQLNEKGRAILEKSGIKEIVDEHRSRLLALVAAKKPTNAYDAEQMILAVVNQLPTDYPELTERLKDGAFKVGDDIGTVLFVGGIYLRNLIFRDLGFSLGEIDAASV